MDPSPLNWLYILFNTMEEAVRADHLGRIVSSLATDYKWLDDTTLELQLRKGVVYHDGEFFNAENVSQNYDEVKQWIAPHPPGTWLNLPDGTGLEVVDAFTVRYNLPKTDGLALGKLRAHHYANHLFWNELGFGYAKLGTAEGHW
ncbi:ABC transporter substrate-binding protein [Virgibacillus sp. DJP39]|uniref:ABC transporter substrate-binding protein n=1 Tax=Virgibacillus sp. DJP39 TaxID=3409790 RepID=UPI003BB62EEA